MHTIILQPDPISTNISRPAGSQSRRDTYLAISLSRSICLLGTLSFFLFPFILNFYSLLHTPHPYPISASTESLAQKCLSHNIPSFERLVPNRSFPLQLPIFPPQPKRSKGFPLHLGSHPHFYPKATLSILQSMARIKSWPFEGLQVQDIGFDVGALGYKRHTATINHD